MFGRATIMLGIGTDSSFKVIIRLGARLQLNMGFSFQCTHYARFCPFLSAIFHETQHVDRCHDESIQNRVLEIFLLGVVCFFPKKCKKLKLFFNVL